MTTAPFDPRAWVAAYEAAGGSLHLIRQHGRHEGLWLCTSFGESDDAENLHAEFSQRDGREERKAAVIAYLAGARGVEDMPTY